MVLQQNLQIIFILITILLHVTIAEDAMIGDVQLVSTSVSKMYEVQVYFGNGLQPPSWVGICQDHSYHVHNVVCQQLGYEPWVPDSESFTGVANTTQIKLFNVDCRDMLNANHILRCKYDVSQTGSDCSNTAKPALAIKCHNDFNTPLSPYDGQVILCPPQLIIPGTNIYKRSASLGVIGVRLHKKIMGITQPNPIAGSVKESQSLGGSEADAICRELGYTGVIPGSIATKTSYENTNVKPLYNFSHCYSAENTVKDFPFRYVHTLSWLSTDQILKCTNLRDSQKCFGCCYDYPKDDCGDSACTANNNDVVIRCGFDPSKIGKEVGTAGSNVTCAFNKEQKIEQCVSVCTDTEQKLHKIKKDYGWSIGAFVLFTMFFGVCCFFLVYSLIRRRWGVNPNYQPLPGDNQGRQQGVLQGGEHDEEQQPENQE